MCTAPVPHIDARVAPIRPDEVEPSRQGLQGGDEAAASALHARLAAVPQQVLKKGQALRGVWVATSSATRWARYGDAGVKQF